MGVAAMAAGGCVDFKMNRGGEAEKELRAELEKTRADLGRADQSAAMRQADIERLQQEMARLGKENLDLISQRETLRGKLKEEQVVTVEALKQQQEATRTEKAATARREKLEEEVKVLQLALRNASSELAVSRAEIAQLKENLEKVRTGGERPLEPTTRGRGAEEEGKAAELEKQLRAREAGERQAKEQARAAMDGRAAMMEEIRRLKDQNTALGTEVVRLRATLEGKRSASRPGRP